MSQSKKLYLTINELMQRWSISRATVYNMLSAGQLSRIKIRGATRIPVADVERIEKEGGSS